MKSKTSRQVPTFKDLADVANFTQSLTDDLSVAIGGGLSMADGNLPFALYKVQATSGRAFQVTGVGATVIFSDAPLTKTAWKTIKQDLLEVTLTLDKPTASVILLVIKERP